MKVMELYFQGGRGWYAKKIYTSKLTYNTYVLVEEQSILLAIMKKEWMNWIEKDYMIQLYQVKRQLFSL